jgi:plasmid stabilization system protein ParE
MSGRSLRYAPRAVRDLEDERAYLESKFAGSAAWQRLTHVRSAINALKIAPCRWPIWPKRAGTRKLSVEGYVIIYRVMPDTGDNHTAGYVTILRVYGPHQNR